MIRIKSVKLELVVEWLNGPSSILAMVQLAFFQISFGRRVDRSGFELLVDRISDEFGIFVLFGLKFLSGFRLPGYSQIGNFLILDRVFLQNLVQ